MVSTSSSTHPDGSHLDPLDAPSLVVLEVSGALWLGPPTQGPEANSPQRPGGRVDKWGRVFGNFLQAVTPRQTGAALLLAQGKEPGHLGPRGSCPS